MAHIYSTDEEWFAAVKQITKKKDLLQELVDLDDEVMGVGDPYYRDFYQAIIDRARELFDAE